MAAEPMTYTGSLSPRPGLVQLRTLVVVRWLVIATQVVVVLAASRAYDVALPEGPVFVVIAAAAVANIALMLAFPWSRRLSGREAVPVILFDILQLGALLALTGGLNNPFALLILVPVTVTATVLPVPLTLALGAVALLMATALGLWHLPLHTEAGQLLTMPPTLVTGLWVAIFVGVLFLGFYARRVTSELQAMSEALLATQMALAREQKLTDLGGVVAAAAHELGTPLATIKLVSTEIAEELDDPQLREDAQLIGQQADRCRDILRSMGRAGKDDRHMRRAPLGAVLREAAEPHLGRGVRVHFHLAPMGGSPAVGSAAGPAAGDDPRQPHVRRSPELIHGLRNLIQNAVDFARSSVWVEARWSSEEIALTITDDGPGFPPQLLGRIGEPFLGRGRGDGPGDRSGDRSGDWPLDPGADWGAPGGHRPGYEGMGLGLFIAKTLLERSGARLAFSNAGDPFAPGRRAAARLGARVALRWRRAALEGRRRRRAPGREPPLRALRARRGRGDEGHWP